VVLGEPITVVAELVGETGEVEGVPEGVGSGGVFRNRGLIENADAKVGRFWHGGFASMVIDASQSLSFQNVEMSLDIALKKASFPPLPYGRGSVKKNTAN
jgi:hypothetical protein